MDAVPVPDVNKRVNHKLLRLKSVPCYESRWGCTSIVSADVKMSLPLLEALSDCRPFAPSDHTIRICIPVESSGFRQETYFPGGSLALLYMREAKQGDVR